MTDTCQTTGKIAKVDKELGLVFGYAIVCSEGGEPYFDLQGDHIPEDAMLKAVLDFMEHSRVAGDMHGVDFDGKGQIQGVDDPEIKQAGTIVFEWPLTSDVAKALDIETSTTGLLIAVKPGPDLLAKFKSGEYTGFSIGGSRITDEAVTDAQKHHARLQGRRNQRR